jgi:hypothetical protein
LPAPPGGRRAAPRGKFPDLANIPTMIAEEDRPELAPTAPPGKTVDPQVAMQKTVADLPAPGAQQGYAAAGAGPAGPTSAPTHPVRTSAPVLNDYPVIPGGQRPLSSDLAPSTLPPQRPSYPTGSHDPAHAASLVSPVGEHYPQTDWERAAAISAKALPPWMLVALFSGALVVALLVTLAIAKIFV